MAKENNPNPNKFKVSPWLIYTAAILLFLIYQFCNWWFKLKSQDNCLNSTDYLEKTN
jgi:cell division protease FtsH